jgi:hypothetical protein
MAAVSEHIFEAETLMLPCMVAATDDGGYENTGVPRQFARATRETVTPKKGFGFMLDDGVRLYRRSWVASW